MVILSNGNIGIDLRGFTIGIPRDLIYLARVLF